MAIASGPDDPGILAALAVAASSNEQLRLIPSRPDLSLSTALERARLAGVAASLGKAAFPEGLLPASMKGRLLVMSRKLLTGRPLLSQTPILLVSAELFSGADVLNPKLEG